MLAGRSIKEWIGLAAFVAVGLFAVKAYYGNSGSLAVTSESQAAPIDEDALSNYSRANYPRTYDAWGEDGVDRIKERERAAANHVARSGQCDRVTYVGLSEKESSPPNEIVVYVDCENKNRFYVGSYELTKEPWFLKVRKKIY
ncbi:hypothetical protein [Pseudomonas sp. zfem005]|uniref:hypothetical protein n=1 Tax=Pseudomonas sp. zfem005 TaxID=3078200 RepID=UPI002927E792|nr:hypothetical protein [Pseudomonas sp. zfem005]MDU9415572.1 hypothetical protein [Pseudomonas sp. zfem005]